jgi:hypothetical protein
LGDLSIATQRWTKWIIRARPTSKNYATGDEAVGALLALGIKPVS